MRRPVHADSAGDIRRTARLVERTLRDLGGSASFDELQAAAGEDAPLVDKAVRHLTASRRAARLKHTVSLEGS